jgi:hypothetical protein
METISLDAPGFGAGFAINARPPAIFDQIINGLTDDANAQYEANTRAMNEEPEPSGIYYVMKQFQRVE